jgi:hypothetical protein
MLCQAQSTARHRIRAARRIDRRCRCRRATGCGPSRKTVLPYSETRGRRWCRTAASPAAHRDQSADRGLPQLTEICRQGNVGGPAGYSQSRGLFCRADPEAACRLGLEQAHHIRHSRRYQRIAWSRQPAQNSGLERGVCVKGHRGYSLKLVGLRVGAKRHQSSSSCA